MLVLVKFCCNWVNCNWMDEIDCCVVIEDCINVFNWFIYACEFVIVFWIFWRFVFISFICSFVVLIWLFIESICDWMLDIFCYMSFLSFVRLFTYVFSEFSWLVSVCICPCISLICALIVSICEVLLSASVWYCFWLVTKLDICYW